MKGQGIKSGGKSMRSSSKSGGTAEMTGSMIDLDECVLNALDLFAKSPPPRFSVDFKRPLVVGSGNAAVTGKIIFQGSDAIFANESDYGLWLDHVDGAVIISASGGKHAPIIARELRKHKIKTVLMTTNANAPAKPLVDKVYVFPKNPEPYTYNTSTYLGMILSRTGENPRKIKQFIQDQTRPRIPDLSRYNAFVMIIPDRLESERFLFQTKFDELFGPRINGRIFTEDQMKHAKTIVPSSKECFISIGVKNTQWGDPKRRYEFPLPSVAKDSPMNVALMAIGYYIIGNIQKQNPPWFKQNIVAFTKKASEIFGEKIDPIVK